MSEVAVLVVVNELTSTADLREAATHLAKRAAREFPVVGTPARPTPWDLRHGAINDVLTMLDERVAATS